jgi:hypothetical protein
MKLAQIRRKRQRRFVLEDLFGNAAIAAADDQDLAGVIVC